MQTAVWRAQPEKEPTSGRGGGRGRDPAAAWRRRQQPAAGAGRRGAGGAREPEEPRRRTPRGLRAGAPAPGGSSPSAAAGGACGSAGEGTRVGTRPERAATPTGDAARRGRCPPLPAPGGGSALRPRLAPTQLAAAPDCRSIGGPRRLVTTPQVSASATPRHLLRPGEGRSCLIILPRRKTFRRFEMCSRTVPFAAGQSGVYSFFLTHVMP